MLLSPQVRESLAANLECRETHERMSISRNVFDRLHARRDSDEKINDSRNLTTSVAILRKEGIENSGSEEPLQSILLLSFSRTAREKSKWQNLSYVHD